MAGMNESRMTSHLAAGALVVALLHFVQSIFVPLAFSLFIIALLWPTQAALQRRMPQLLALLITLIITIIVIVAVGSSIAWGFGQLGQWLFANAGRFQAIYVAWLLGFSQGMAGKLNSMAGFAVLVFIFVMLGLLEADDFNARLRLPVTQPYGEKIRQANREIGRKLRRFMIVRSFASVLTGLIVWGFALVAGLELASAWGGDRFCAERHPLSRSACGDGLPDAVRHRAIRVLENGDRRLYRPQRHPIHHRQLSGTPADWSFTSDFALRRHFCGFLLEFHVGSTGRLHRCTNTHRVHSVLRAGAFEPVACGAAVGLGLRCSMADRADAAAPSKCQSSRRRVRIQRRSNSAHIKR